MDRKPLQHPLMLVFTNLVIGLEICAVASLLVTGFWFFKFDHFRVHQKLGILTWIGLAGIGIGLALLPVLHVLVLLLVRHLSTHSIRDRIGPIMLLLTCAAVPGLIVILAKRDSFYRDARYDISQVVFGVCLAIAIMLTIVLRMNAFAAFSLPSNWMTIVPILISYVVLVFVIFSFCVGDPRMISFFVFGRFYYGYEVAWLQSLIPVILIGGVFLTVFILVSGAIFPTHRRIAELWKPRRLPKIKPWPGVPATNGRS